MKTIGSLICLFLTLSSFSQTDILKEPWTNDNNQIIIDSYGLNTIDFEKLATDKRVVGLIHKATEGSTFNDRKFKARREASKKNNLLFGSYHLGLAGDPIKQAKFYLITIGNHENEILALAIEGVDSKFMSLAEAEEFIKYIFNETGKYPLLYINHIVYKEINSKYDDNSVFSKCLLWYARFRKNIPEEQFESTIWDSYFLWQFSSELNCKKTGKCLYNVPGTKYDMDINVFNGSRQELLKIWSNGELPIETFATERLPIETFESEKLIPSSGIYENEEVSNTSFYSNRLLKDYGVKFIYMKVNESENPRCVFNFHSENEEYSNSNELELKEYYPHTIYSSDQKYLIKIKFDRFIKNPKNLINSEAVLSFEIYVNN